MTEKIVGAFTQFGKLKKVLVGTMHPNDYYDIIPDKEFRERFRLINDETIEDLDNLANVIKDYGAEVFRTKDMFDQPGVYSNGVINVVNPRPPYIPRDFCDFVDNKMLGIVTNNQPHEYFSDYAYYDLYNSFANQGAEWHQMPKSPGLDFDDVDYNSDDYPQNIFPIWNASNVTKLGSNFYCSPLVTANQKGYNWYKSVIGDKVTFREFKNEHVYYAHVDSRVHILRPGLVVSENPKEVLYENMPELKGWDCIHLPTDNSGKLKSYFGMGTNHFCSQFAGRFDISQWSSDWLRNMVDDDVLNTNFDINIISLDENTVIIPEENPEYQRMLAKHNVDSIVCKLRHKFFWGNGLNCHTADILREDECIDYTK